MQSKRTVKFLYVGLLLLAITESKSVGAEEFVITGSNVILCKAPTENCVPNSYKTADWQGCKPDRAGCYVRQFDMKLPAGEVVQTISPKGEEFNKGWVFVKARQCIPPRCENTFSGWLKQSQVAYLSEFKRVASWPTEQEFEMQVGDWAGSIKIRRDGTFSYSDNTDDCGALQCKRGAIYTHRNMLWARFEGNPYPEYIFIQPVGMETFCWTHAPDGGYNCFLSPFKSAFPQLPDGAKETEAFLIERIPLGTSIARARSRMKGLGFECTLYDGGLNDDSTGPSQICERTLIASGAKREWVVILRPSEKGKLDSVQVQYERSTR